MGRFITFEGIEGAGKTTQMRLAGRYLRALKIPCITTQEPGGTALGKKIRRILLNQGNYTVAAEAELMLFLAARLQHVREIITPALNEGKWVLCDRFVDATYAYQGFGRGLDLALIKRLHELTIGPTTKPDLTFLFDLPPEEGLRRALRRIARRKSNKEDRFEREMAAFHEKIREGYLTLAKKEPQRFIIIDAGQEVMAIQDNVRRALEKMARDSGYL